MPHPAGVVHHPRPRLAALLLALGVLLSPGLPLAAQSGKKVLSVDDYARWKSIENSRISGDGVRFRVVARVSSQTYASARARM